MATRNERRRMIFLGVVMVLLCYVGKYLEVFGRTGRKFDPVVIFNDKILVFCREQLLQPLLFSLCFYSL